MVALMIWLTFLVAVLIGKLLRLWIQRPYPQPRPADASASVGTIVTYTSAFGPPGRKVDV